MHLHQVIPENLIPGDPVTVHGLGIIPIIGDTAVDLPTMDLLEQAFDGGTFKVAEMSEEGTVPFLRGENIGAKPVLILEGEELVGGKQNRIVNTTIIILAGSSIQIPVSCMEAGRWDYRRRDFDSGGAIFRAKSRAVQKASVACSLRADGSFRSDQGAVWDQVSESLAQLGASSATADFRAGREKAAHQIEDIVQAVRPLDKQVGAIFLADGKILGCELLATWNLFARALGKIVRSFAFEVLSGGETKDISTDEVTKWWEKILASQLTRHASPGAGEDIRLDSPDLLGSGLYWNGNLVHLSCFPAVESSQDSSQSQNRRASVSERRNRMRNR
jgi:hypothetical protein